MEFIWKGVQDGLSATIFPSGTHKKSALIFAIRGMFVGATIGGIAGAISGFSKPPLDNYRNRLEKVYFRLNNGHRIKLGVVRILGENLDDSVCLLFAFRDRSRKNYKKMMHALYNIAVIRRDAESPKKMDQGAFRKASNYASTFLQQAKLFYHVDVESTVQELDCISGSVRYISQAISESLHHIEILHKKHERMLIRDYVPLNKRLS